MTIRYEINPPKIDQNKNFTKEELKEILGKLLQRVSEIRKYCNGIHLTDSVLGIPRVSPIITSSFIKENNYNIEITASLRVIDKTIESITEIINRAVSQNLDGILVLKGDVPNYEIKKSGLISSQVVKHLNELGFDKKIDLFLSLPNNPDFSKIQKKIEAEPTGFITQVIHSVDQVSKIVDKLKPLGFKIIPIVLIPSEKNIKSAEFLKLDWSNYQDDVISFVNEIHNLAGDVLLTSPNDFLSGKKVLENLS